MDSSWIEHPLIVDVTEMGNRRYEQDLQYTLLSTLDHTRYVLTEKTRFLYRGKTIDQKTAEGLVFSKNYKVYAVSVPNVEVGKWSAFFRNDPVYSTKRRYPTLLVATFRHKDRTQTLHALCSVYNHWNVPQPLMRLTASLLQC